MLQLKSQIELIEHLRTYSGLVYISGFGDRQQYNDIDAVVAATEVPLFHAKSSIDARFGAGKWACCFGGDRCNPAAPDVGMLVHRLHSKHGMKLIAIQADIVMPRDHRGRIIEDESPTRSCPCWPRARRGRGVDDHIDAVYYYPTEYEEDGKTVAWGGLKGGVPVGATRILLEVVPCCGLPVHWISAGGGNITLDGLQAAWDHDIAILCIEALARIPQDSDQPCGPCKPFWDGMLDYKEFGMFRAQSEAFLKRQRKTLRIGCVGSPVLITGATGLLGREVLKDFEEHGWDARGCGFSRATGRVFKCDLLQAGEVEALLDKFKPIIVIHCAAERRPDVLEKDKEYAKKINVDMTGNIGKLCKARGIWLIYLSTNYVFDGKDAPYAEDALPNPVNTYGESKLAGEWALAEMFPAAATLRVPLLYGPIEYLGETSVTDLLSKIQQDPHAKLDNWQERFPTCSTDVARVLEAVCSQYMLKGKANPDRFAGVFHWQANVRHTKYTMAQVIAEIACIDSSELVAVNDAPAPGSAPRPQFERMLCDRVEAILKEETSTPLEEFRSDFKAGLAKHLRPFLRELMCCASSYLSESQMFQMNQIRSKDTRRDSGKMVRVDSSSRVD